MSFLTKMRPTVFLGLGCCQILLQGANSSYHTHRVPLAFPISSPFTLEAAAGLPEWDQIRRMTDLLKTDRGSRGLLHEMPQVEARYANESYFLDLVRKWRDRIPALPRNPDSAVGDTSSWVVLENGGSRTISITFRHEVPENSITVMRITWVGGEITNLTFAGGFENVPPQRHRHRNVRT